MNRPVRAPVGDRDLLTGRARDGPRGAVAPPAGGARVRRGPGRLFERAPVRLRVRRHLRREGQQGPAPAHAARQPIRQRLLGHPHGQGEHCDAVELPRLLLLLLLSPYRSAGPA